MKLKSFQVTKFRNIVDSGLTDLDEQVTCFVGKNEAGKSCMIEALYLFNPAYGEKFDLEDQYPRWLKVQDRKKGDLKTTSPVTVCLQLDDADVDAVSAAFGPDVIAGRSIQVAKRYDGTLDWAFTVDESAACAAVNKKLASEVQSRFASAHTLADLHAALKASGEGENPLTPEQQQAAQKAIAAVGDSRQALVDHVAKVLTTRLPKFFRFTQYSTLPGRIDFNELASKSADGPGKSALQTARALLQLAGTDTTQLCNENYELRRGELEAVQIDLTRQVFEYWKQNPYLEVLIDTDKVTVPQNNGHTAVARFLDIRLRDTRTGYSNNFSQRSAGFQWFFSFLAAFSEFENGPPPIVLLDEPALTLHGKAQADFLRFINERLAETAQVLYTTHSPFMVETNRFHRVRIVEDKGPPAGAVCSKDVLGKDPYSLFPLQAALGYDIAQNLFIGPNNLVVEGTSDFIYLTVMSAACSANGRTSLDEAWRVIPAGGATNIPTFVSLVGPHLDVTVFADSDTQGMQRINNMVSQNLLAGHRLILANAVRPGADADTEDLFDAEDYLKLYNLTFGARMTATELSAGPRIVKRIEAKAGKFDHGRVAETLLRGHAGLTFTTSTLDNFAKLFTVINATKGA